MGGGSYETVANMLGFFMFVFVFCVFFCVPMMLHAVPKACFMLTTTTTINLLRAGALRKGLKSDLHAFCPILEDIVPELLHLLGGHKWNVDEGECHPFVQRLCVCVNAAPLLVRKELEAIN